MPDLFRRQPGIFRFAAIGRNPPQLRILALEVADKPYRPAISGPRNAKWSAEAVRRICVEQVSDVMSVDSHDAQCRAPLLEVALDDSHPTAVRAQGQTCNVRGVGGHVNVGPSS